MKAKLVFNLPEETAEFKDAQNGSIFHSILQDLDNMLRNKLKHEDGLSEQTINELDAIRKWLYENAEERGVSIWG